MREKPALDIHPHLWVVVASRVEAKIFAGHGPNDLAFVRSLSHPSGRLKNSEINSDAPGRTQDSYGHSRHSYMRSLTPKEAEAESFAHEIAKLLDHERSSGVFSKLILVAEPQFLGECESVLDKTTQKLVSQRIHHDLIPLEDSEITNRLKSLIQLD